MDGDFEVMPCGTREAMQDALTALRTGSDCLREPAIGALERALRQPGVTRRRAGEILARPPQNEWHHG